MKPRQHSNSPANFSGASGSSDIRLGRGTGEAGADTAPNPASPKSTCPTGICIACDGPATEPAILADNAGNPLRLIAICTICLAIGDALGLTTTLQAGKA